MGRAPLRLCALEQEDAESSASADELRALRRPACGLNPDIEHSPTAIRRPDPDGDCLSSSGSKFWFPQAAMSLPDTTIDASWLQSRVISFNATATSPGDQIFEGCAANSFPAAVVLQVSKDMPEELRRAYPDATGLQFVYDESESESESDVAVFSSTSRD